MFVQIAYLLAGILSLYFGAEWLVRAAAALARGLGVPPVVVGLTVVAYGTSAPELVVSSVASWEGKGSIALGNVIGSNIANLGLVLGVTSMLAPPRVEASLIRREVPVMMASALLVPLMLLDGTVSRTDGLLLLVAAAAFSAMTLRAARRVPLQDPLAGESQAELETTAGLDARSPLRNAALSAVGLGLLLLGGKGFVDGASGLALSLGLSERTVGLTIVAVGTSLPEMAASLMAAYRGHSSLAIGNVVGSNIFNVLLILGAAAVVHPVEGSVWSLRLDLGALVALSLVATLLLKGERSVRRSEGVLLTLAYGGFLALLAAGM